MAEILQFSDRAKPAGHSAVLEPFALRLIEQGNGERSAIVAKADVAAKRARARMNMLDRELSETDADLDRARAEFRSSCGERRHRPQVPTWAFFLLAACAVLGEWAIAYELLDFLGVRGHPDPGKPLSAYFAGVGTWEGISAAISDYANEKAVLSLSLAASAFGLAKMTGTWLKQRPARRSSGVPDLAAAAGNLAFLAMAGGFSYLREVQLAREGGGEMAGAWVVFLGVQCFAYVAAAALSAWAADPDPEAARLSERVAKLTAERARVWGERAALAEKSAALCAGARNAAAETAHRIAGMVAAYRDANFASRPASSPPPAFMRTAVGEDSFAPLPLDPFADPPAREIGEAVGRIGNGTEAYRKSTEAVRRTY